MCSLYKPVTVGLSITDKSMFIDDQSEMECGVYWFPAQGFFQEILELVRKKNLVWCMEAMQVVGVA